MFAKNYQWFFFYLKTTLTYIFVLFSSSLSAQIIPDNSLNTLVNGINITSCNLGTCTITGGTSDATGTNLFHSFNTFSIPPTVTADFIANTGVQNIFTRVTGNSISNIEGLLKSNTNFYLINPNGIIFGNNSQLDINGSFFATTVSSLQFANKGSFGVNTGNDVSLLNIQPTALFTNQIPADIQVKNILAVPNSQKLILVGGNIDINGGEIKANSGYIHLSSLAQSGTFNINNSNTTPEIAIPNNTQLGNITLSNGGKIIADSNNTLNAGYINLNSNQLILDPDSLISASSLTTSTANAGLITLKSNNIKITGNQEIGDRFNQIFYGTFKENQRTTGIFASSFNNGIAGQINIYTQDLYLEKGALISNSNFGDAITNSPPFNSQLKIIGGGNITLDNSGMITGTRADGGQAGALTIQKTPDNLNGLLLLKNGSSLATTTISNAKGGDIFIDYPNITIKGVSPTSIPLQIYYSSHPIPSSILTASFGTNAGDAGSVMIETNNLNVEEGGLISTLTNGQGKGGDITINANNSVAISGLNESFWNTVLLKLIASFPTPVFLPDDVRGGIFTLTYGTGESGNLNIITPDLKVVNNGVIATTTLGVGNGGNLTLSSPFGVSQGSIFLDHSFVVAGTTLLGDSGELSINTQLLKTRNGSIITTGSISLGDAGDIVINTDVIDTKTRETIIDIPITSTDALGDGIDSITSLTFGSGNGGNIIINTGELNMFDSQIDSHSFILGPYPTDGRPGDIWINATRHVNMTGNPLNNVNTPFLPFNAAIVTYTSSVFLQDFVDNTTQPAGNITIITPQLNMSNQAVLRSTSQGKGNAGNIFIKADNSINLSGFSTFEQKAQAFLNVNNTIFMIDGIFSLSGLQGNAGNITLDTPQLNIDQGFVISTTTVRFGQGGDLTILDSSNSPNSAVNISDSLLITGTRSLVSQQAIAGDLSIQTNTLNLSKNAGLISSSLGLSQGGNINLNLYKLTISDSSTIATSAFSSGDAGTINIVSRNTTLNNYSEITVKSQGQGTAGNINLTGDNLSLWNHSSINAETFATNGGNINLTLSDLLLMRYNSNISASAGTALAGGDGGNMNIKADFIVAVPDENSDITANAFTGKGGKINISAMAIYGLKFRRENTPLSDITANSQLGSDGQVDINLNQGDNTQALDKVVEYFSPDEQPMTCITGGVFMQTGQGGKSPQSWDRIIVEPSWTDTRLMLPSQTNSKIIFSGESSAIMNMNRYPSSAEKIVIQNQKIELISGSNADSLPVIPSSVGNCATISRSN